MKKLIYVAAAIAISLGLWAQPSVTEAKAMPPSAATSTDSGN